MCRARDNAVGESFFCCVDVVNNPRQILGEIEIVLCEMLIPPPIDALLNSTSIGLEVG